MRRIRLQLLLAVAIAASSCADATSPDQDLDPWGLGDVAPSLSVIEELPPVCGTPTATRLIADEIVPIGTVEISQDASYLYVMYRTDESWPIGKTAVFVGTRLADLPTSGGGNPRVGHFPHKALHDAVTRVVWQIPLQGLEDRELVVAAFAEREDRASGAWAEGSMISARGNWSMYFTHTPSACAAETVDAAGGSVATVDGRASIVVPPGALADPIDLTIETSSVPDLVEYVEDRTGLPAGAAALASPATSQAAAAVQLDGFQTLYDLVPIPGSVFDFGPDGTTFLTPTTVVLHYDETKLPPGVDEAELGVFLINGVIPYDRLPSIVDTDANTVTARASHFSFFFVAHELPTFVDLTVSDLWLGSSSEAEVGASMDFSADVMNVGGEAAGGGTVTYQAFGDVELGGLFGGCSELEPIFGTVAVSCPVTPLAVGATDGIPVLQLVAGSPGDVEVWATVSTATGDVDLNGDNDRATLTVTVEEAFDADVDLTVSQLFLSSTSEPAVGLPMDFGSDVMNLGPEASSGGTLTYQAFGDVTLGGLFGGCVEEPTPIFGKVVVYCDVQALASGATDGVPVLQIVAQSPGDVEVWATVSTVPTERDVQQDNDRRTLRIAVEPESTAEVDLTVSQLFLSASSEAEVGSPLDFGSDVTNLGPDASAGGTLVYQAFGNVVLGGLFGNCVETDDPIFGAVEVRCDVTALAPGATDGIPVLQLVAQSPGNVEVWATARPAEGDTDSDGTNDRLTLTLSVTEAFDADVDYTVSELFLSASSDPVVGSPLDFASSVMNLGPEASSGGTLTYQAFGDVVLGGLFGGCTANPLPVVGAVEVTCPVTALLPGATDGVPVLQLVAQSEGDVEVWATAHPVASERDVDPDNDRRTIRLAIGGASGQADLTVGILNESTHISLGQFATLQMLVANAGPDDVTDAVVYYQMFGNAEAGPLAPGCSETAVPAIAEVEIVCSVGAVTVAGGAVVAPPAAFRPLGTGNFTVWASPGSSASDPNVDNNRYETTVTVAAAQADLSIIRLIDTPDPVEAGGLVSYLVAVVAVDAVAPVSGARVEIAFSGDATYERASIACSPTGGGFVECLLPTLEPGIPLTFELEMTLLTGGQTVTAQARIVAPAGITDPTPINNSRSAVTEVLAPPPSELFGGDYEWLLARMSQTGVLDDTLGIAGHTLEYRVDALEVLVDGSGRIVVGGQRRGSLQGVQLTRHRVN